MTFSIYDASAPLFVNGLADMRQWLDKAAAEKPEAELLAARLAPDMLPLTAQYQIASDSAKNAIARLCGIEPPAMPDTEASFAELKERCDKTIAFVQGASREAVEAGEHREVTLRFPGGIGFKFTGRDYLTGFALPNFFFHVTTAYGILRASGVAMGKPDFMQHLGPPNLSAE
ncbi:MAG: DUF1993 domain-containing protein [Sphingosinicella sp.]|nr:DUF1993 domain-containing protein [Sphingosinicella sp.]